ncbi:MAG: hypothetical protein M0Z99_32020 [Betaproteobacteria bacterium]|nr:hypothetical protein [Betaproteobacteria bacterium]
MFIKTILANPDVLAALIFCIAAVIGQMLHAVKKWADGESWVLSNFRRTIGAVIGNMVGMVVFIQTGVLGPIMAQPNGLFALILFGVTNGFTSDSALNKGTRKVLTDDERAALKDPA